MSPKVNHELMAERDIADLKSTILNSDLTIGELVSRAWASVKDIPLVKHYFKIERTYL